MDNNFAEERLDICKKCENFLELTKQCKICFCFMNLKTKKRGAECPIGKWTKIEKKDA